jgi:hypothetical protein
LMLRLGACGVAIGVISFLGTGRRGLQRLRRLLGKRMIRKDGRAGHIFGSGGVCSSASADRTGSSRRHIDREHSCALTRRPGIGGVPLHNFHGSGRILLLVRVSRLLHREIPIYKVRSDTAITVFILHSEVRMRDTGPVVRSNGSVRGQDSTCGCRSDDTTFGHDPTRPSVSLRRAMDCCVHNTWPGTSRGRDATSVSSFGVEYILRLCRKHNSPGTRPSATESDGPSFLQHRGRMYIVSARDTRTAPVPAGRPSRRGMQVWHRGRAMN